MYSITLLTPLGEHLTIGDVGKYQVHESVKAITHPIIPLYAREIDTDIKQAYYIPQSALFREYDITWDRITEFLYCLHKNHVIHKNIYQDIHSYACYVGTLTASEKSTLSELAFEMFPYLDGIYVVVPSRYLREKGYFNE